MGCTTSAPVDEEAAPKQDLKSKEPPSKLDQPSHRDSGISAHNPGASRKEGTPSWGTSDTKEVLATVAVASVATLQPTMGKNESFKQKEHADALRDGQAQKKERRLGFGSEVVRDQLRKMAVGGPQPANQTAFYEVSDSSEEETEAEGPAKPAKKINRSSSVIYESKNQDVIEKLSAALETSFVFRGIDKEILKQVVNRMYPVEFAAGESVLQQAALPKPDDCLYYLDEGEVDIIISGGADNVSSEERNVEGNKVKIHKMPGWVFGDVALLFNSPRSASVVAATDIVLWAMDRRTFLKFVMRHAPGARALRFVRKLPLLKGLSDNNLISVAARMGEEVYEDGQPLIRYGERGDKLYLIRYGKVRVLRPDEKTGGHIEVALLGRGHFVGERTLITGKLRSADCVAKGQVQVVVISKKDFLDLDNPLLSWMLDYDAIAAVLRGSNILGMLSQEVLEAVIDRFEREEVLQGNVVLAEGDNINKLTIVKMGEVSCTSGVGGVAENSFLLEMGGFSYFGHRSLQVNECSPFTVTCTSEKAILLSLSRRAVATLMSRDEGPRYAKLSSDDVDICFRTLRSCVSLQPLTDQEFKGVLNALEMRIYGKGDVVGWVGEPHEGAILVTNGECVITRKILQASRRPDHIEDISISDGRSLPAGILYGEAALTTEANFGDSIVATSDNTHVVTLTREALETAIGGHIKTLAMRSNGPQLADSHQRQQSSFVSGRARIKYSDLLPDRIVGTGQFGSVKVVKHKVTGEVFALKAMFKSPITESKQVEHVINERRIMEEADHQFCVHLLRAFQDRSCLYLLQEWLPGGELFHHLDIEGAFDDATAMFYTANVLLALEHLHSRGIVYRDLKPENLLLDASGYIKVADFGFAKKIGSEKTYTICGTPDYQAPEVIMRRGTGMAADYWALGVLIFEMLVGDPPFKSSSGDPWDTFRRTLSGRFFVPNFISDGAADLIYKLLQVNPERRLGSGVTGAQEIKEHKWFASLDWEAMEAMTLPAPIQPKIKSSSDTSNFDNFDTQEPPPPPSAGRADKHAHSWDLWDWIDGDE